MEEEEEEETKMRSRELRCESEKKTVKIGTVTNGRDWDELRSIRVENWGFFLKETRSELVSRILGPVSGPLVI